MTTTQNIINHFSPTTPAEHVALKNFREAKAPYDKVRQLLTYEFMSIDCIFDAVNFKVVDNTAIAMDKIIGEWESDRCKPIIYMLLLSNHWRVIEKSVRVSQEIKLFLTSLSSA